MYSIIIPTMWGGTEIEAMLPLLEKHSLVGEILLINNSIARTPNWYKLGKWIKIKQYNPPDNIGVNPAWNLGVRESKNDKICLLSDDVEFPVDVLEFLYDKLSSEQGCVGPLKTNINVSASVPYKLDQFNKLVPAMRMRGQYGCMMFLNKENWVPIPEEFKIFYGDNWIFMNHVLKKKQPRFLLNNRIRTLVGSTSGDPAFEPQAQREIAAWTAAYGNSIQFTYEEEP